MVCAHRVLYLKHRAVAFLEYLVTDVPTGGNQCMPLLAAVSDWMKTFSISARGGQDQWDGCSLWSGFIRHCIYRLRAVPLFS